MTKLMKRYEAETGNEVQSNAFAQHEIWEYIRWLESQLTEQTLEKFQEIIRTQCDEISALKAQLTWRPVSEKPEEGDRYLIKYRQGKIVKRFIADYDTVAGWNIPLSDVELIEWLPIPPAPEGNQS